MGDVRRVSHQDALDFCKEVDYREADLRTRYSHMFRAWSFSSQEEINRYCEAVKKLGNAIINKRIEHDRQIIESHPFATFADEVAITLNCGTISEGDIRNAM